MGIFRIYTGAEGKTRIEELDLSSHPELTSATHTKDISFLQWAPGHFIDWHPAPRRQYIISLSGIIEIGLEDGATHRFMPGDARLVEDTTGKGHTTLVPGDEPSITAVIPLL
jgi:quercetin dioxygenase-like cupin family protein